MENELNENFYFTGTIIARTTSEDGIMLTIQNNSSVKTFKIEDSIDDYGIGNNVIVHYKDEEDGSDPVIMEIKKL